MDLAAIPIPVFLSFKATQTNDPRDDTQWLMYWSVFGLLRLLDYADGVLHLVGLRDYLADLRFSSDHLLNSWAYQPYTRRFRSTTRSKWDSSSGSGSLGLAAVSIFITFPVSIVPTLPCFPPATTLYQKFISPFLQKNQQRIDSGLSIVGQRMEETAQQALNAAGSQVLRERLRTNSQGQM